MRQFLLLLAAVVSMTTAVSAEAYLVSQYRAAPGKFPALLALLETTNWQAIDGGKPLMMRHSQGNHWDVMLLAKFNPDCIRSSSCTETMVDFNKKARELVDFELNFLAHSNSSWTDLVEANKTTGMYHIEMFNAAAGKHEALRRQRRIENDYLAKTGQVTNHIFDVEFGSDIDIFTVGFHKSLESFAKAGPPSAEVAEKAAVEAGFKNRADISFHLRELLAGHHDTLAVPVR